MAPLLWIFCCPAALCFVAQLCPTLMDWSPTDASVHGDSPGKNSGVNCHGLFQGIFPTQGSNPNLLHCRWILYCLSHQGSPCCPEEEPEAQRGPLEASVTKQGMLSDSSSSLKAPQEQGLGLLHVVPPPLQLTLRAHKLC